MGEMVRLYFEANGIIDTAYKRYMWRWDGINNTSYPSHFQMGRIRINNVSLPYTYVSYAKGSGQDSSFDEMAYRLVTAESTGQYDKWVIFNMYPQSPECWGYIIFDLPEAVIPASYYLKTTNDSQMNQFPTRMRLYGTNDLTANDSSSSSWVLLSDVSNFLLPSSYFTWSNPIDMNAAGVSNYYLLAPSDLSIGTGLRYEVQDPPGPGPEPVDPYNPLGLPPFTIRCKFSSGYTPTMGDSQTLVDQTENVWDITKNNTSWYNLFQFNNRVIEILGANATGVTNMDSMFQGCTSLTTVSIFDTTSCTNMEEMFVQCTSLTTVPLFDTSSCTNMRSMFGNCAALISVPLFDTRSCTNMISMFSHCESLTSIPLFDTSSCGRMMAMFDSCFNVQYGALALYQQVSTQAAVPSHNEYTFSNCGRDTVTGAAELAQIPTSWGGTMA